MRIFLFLVTFLLGLPAQAQHTISGSFSPAKEFTWLIAYHLRPDGQVYAADTAIKNGRFSLKMDAKKPIGIYRMVYAVPQEEFYFDVIYNGKEDISFNFNSDKGITFINSTENIPYGIYFKKIHELEGSLISFYSSGNTDVREYEKILGELNSFQKSSEMESENMLLHTFITANRPYIPTKYEPVTKYVAQKKEHYFDYFSVSDTTLQASGFLFDKLTNYVFTALPLKEMSALETEMAMQANVETIAGKVENANADFKFNLFKKLWSQSTGNEMNTLADFIYTTYLKELALTTNNSQTVLDIEILNRLRLGATAPELIWKENGVEKKLSGLNNAERYLLVFWSSQCGHCLHELPALHKELKKHPETTVLAIGLEDDDLTWTKESAKLPSFKHIISLGKWDSEYADLYAIQRTPTYFILDSEKKIIAKPDGDREVVAFLTENE